MTKQRELSDEEVQKLCEKYKDKHVLLEDLSKEFGISSYRVGRYLDKNGVPRKTPSEQASEVNRRGRLKQRKYELNEEYFRQETANMYYVLGFLYADGHISNNRRIRISISRKDRHLLEDIKKDMCFTGHIKDIVTRASGKEYESSYINIGSKPLIEDLLKLGKGHLKEEKMDMSLIPERYELDFIAGFFDGDGSVKVRKQTHNKKNSVTYQVISVIGTKSHNLLDDIQERMQKYGLRKKNVCNVPKKNMYEITYSTMDSYKLYNLFYKERKGDIFLHRKKKRFEEGFSLRDEDHRRKAKLEE